MVEPQHKRVRLPSSDETEDLSNEKKSIFPNFQIEAIHSELRTKCLCKVSLSDVMKTLLICNECFSSQDVNDLDGSQNNALLYTSMVCLFFEVSVKQKSRGIACSRISEVVGAGADNEGAVLDVLFGLLSIENKFISYSAGRALTNLLLMLESRASHYVLEKLVKNICHSNSQLEVGHSIDIIKRIIEWKDIDEHPLEGTSQESCQPLSCLKVTLNPSETQGINEVKFTATKNLESKWFILVSNLMKLIAEYSMNKIHVIVSFLSLWESIISVKANLSVIDTKEFYCGLERLLNLLTIDTAPIIWKKVLDLYNEVLCYGSTLALQDVLAEEPCNLAHLIIRAVKDRRFLDCVPWTKSPNAISGSNNFNEPMLGGPSSSSEESVIFNVEREEDSCNMVLSDTDKTILHKVVLLIFKAIAVTVKETRCDSSSENSSRSGGSGSEDIDMEIIERSLQEVLKKLDAFVKGKFPFHPECPMAEWMVKLFADQDDWLVESMVCGVDVYTGLELRIRRPTELKTCVNPHHTFGVFVETVHLDHDVLLDLLVSNETCFLLYLLRYLKLLRRNWQLFVNESTSRTQTIMTVLTRLRLAIDRLVSKNLFPYNINPVLKLLEKCENLYDN